MFINFLAVVGALSLLVSTAIIVAFGPETYRFIRAEYKDRSPFMTPDWVRSLRRWWNDNKNTIEGISLIVSILGLLWFSLAVLYA